MTVQELKEELETFIEKGWGDCELKTSDQGGNEGEVLDVYAYNTPEYSVITLEIA